MQTARAGSWNVLRAGETSFAKFHPHGMPNYKCHGLGCHSAPSLSGHDTFPPQFCSNPFLSDLLSSHVGSHQLAGPQSSRAASPWVAAPDRLCSAGTMDAAKLSSIGASGSVPQSWWQCLPVVSRGTLSYGHTEWQSPLRHQDWAPDSAGVWTVLCSPENPEESKGWGSGGRWPLGGSFCRDLCVSPSLLSFGGGWKVWEHLCFPGVQRGGPSPVPAWVWERLGVGMEQLRQAVREDQPKHPSEV